MHLSHTIMYLSLLSFSLLSSHYDSETFMESPAGKKTWKLTVEWTPVHPDKLSMSVG